MRTRLYSFRRDRHFRGLLLRVVATYSVLACAAVLYLLHDRPPPSPWLPTSGFLRHGCHRGIELSIEVTPDGHLRWPNACFMLSPAQVAQVLEKFREEFGGTPMVVLELHSHARWHAAAPVLRMLRRNGFTHVDLAVRSLDAPSVQGRVRLGLADDAPYAPSIAVRRGALSIDDISIDRETLTGFLSKLGQGDPGTVLSVRFDDTLTVQGAVAVLDCFAQAQLTSAPVLLVPDT